MRALKLFGVYLRLSTLNEMQYRANFFIQLMNSVLEVATGLGGLALVFYHTDSLAGWGPNELLAVMGVYLLIGGIIKVAIEPNMWALMEGIREGTLDYTIVKPADTQLLVSMARIEIWKAVDIITGLVVLGIAGVRLGQTIGLGQALMFVVALVCGGLILYGLWLIVATTAFWFVRVWSIMEMFQSLYQTGRWPVTIYPGWLQMALTFIVPVAFAVTVPAEVFTGRIDLPTFGIVVGLAVAAMTVSRLFWVYGLRNYHGASA